jgi:hypothetical protein
MKGEDGAEHGGQLGAEHLEGDVAVVLEVVGEGDRGHPARAELPLDRVAVRHRRLQGFQPLGHPTAPCGGLLYDRGRWKARLE